MGPSPVFIPFQHHFLGIGDEHHAEVAGLSEAVDFFQVRVVAVQFVPSF